MSRRFPLVLSLIASGGVHLSALQLLRERLTEENHVELLEAASGKTKRQVEQLLAERFPKPDVGSTVRKLPAKQATTDRLLPMSTNPATGSSTRNRAAVEPLSPGRFKVQFTASAELRDKLELALDLMSHANPSRDLAVVVERAMDLLLAQLQKKRFGKTRTPKPPRSTAARAGSGRRQVTNATRREVVDWDGLRCSYVSPDGRRCEARAFLELDHARPHALGGSDDAENLRLRCRAHNQLWAEQIYVRQHVAERRRVRLRQENSMTPSHAKASMELAAGGARTVFERVRQALTGMGFRSAEARRLVEQVEERHRSAPDSPPIEQILREALLLAPCGDACNKAHP